MYVRGTRRRLNPGADVSNWAREYVSVNYSSVGIHDLHAYLGLSPRFFLNPTSTPDIYPLNVLDVLPLPVQSSRDAQHPR